MRPDLLLPLRTCLLTAIVGCGEKEAQESAGDTEWPTSSDACLNATDVLLDGLATGYVRCEDGAVRRAAAVAVDPAIGAASCAGTETSLYCDTDSDCTNHAYGKCITGYEDFTGDTYCGCTYSCAGDADCDSGEVCAPPGIAPLGRDWSMCVPADCNTNADCDSGECGFESVDDGCGPVASLACRDDAVDVCRTDENCEGADCGIYYTGPGYVCVDENCAIGRPLLVDGKARAAAPQAGSAWSGAAPGLDEDGVEGERWLAVAAMEHASVASFARFTLQLMALGAPPQLLLETQQAAADEVEHARLAYGIASRLLGREVGPGALSLEGFAVETDPEAVMKALIHEACVGETLGVAEALARAEQAQDPVLKAVHARIAADEQRHARLAWSTLQWMVARFGLDPAPHFKAALAQVGPNPIHLAAVDEVIRPCVAALA